MQQQSGHYDLKLAVERSLLPSREPSDYVLDVRGDILFHDDDEPLPVGSVRARVVRIGRALDDDVPMFDVFDGIDQSLHDFFVALFDSGQGDDGKDAADFKTGLVEGTAGSDLLLIDGVELAEAHRGRTVGLFAALRTIEVFGAGCSAVALRTAALTQGKPFARGRLQRHWSRIGFKPVEGTDIMVLDLAFKHPSYAELDEGPAID